LACDQVDAIPRPDAWRAGEHAGLTYSPGYAAPEIIAHAEAGQSRIVVTPAADMWALGVIAYELLTETRVSPPGSDRAEMNAMLMGRKPLPWEETDDAALARLRRLRRLKGTILQCLDRNPLGRPTAEGIVTAWNQMFDGLTTQAAVPSAEHATGEPALAPPPALAGIAAPEAAAASEAATETVVVDSK
jgi:serine/threonine protein kinase